MLQLWLTVLVLTSLASGQVFVTNLAEIYNEVQLETINTTWTASTNVGIIKTY